MTMMRMMMIMMMMMMIFCYHPVSALSTSTSLSTRNTSSEAASLHWLPVEPQNQTHKLCTLMHQIHTGHAPQYLADSVQLIVESSRLRSADTADYIKRRTRTKFGERFFSHSGPATSLEFLT